MCVKNCPEDAFTFEDFLAEIDYDKCSNCGICAEKCPTKAIWTSLKEIKVKAEIKKFNLNFQLFIVFDGLLTIAMAN